MATKSQKNTQKITPDFSCPGFCAFLCLFVALPDKLLPQRRSFQAALHAWYHVHQRRLPWREQPSLYKTVVSEFMLQQTQVATVLPYFARWLVALPDFAALAAAPEAQVLKLWEGLGYYSRARNLHRLARAFIVAPLPLRTPEAWRELPGVGPYTAAAITSIAFDIPAAVVDGNVVRILARLTGESRRFRDSGEAVQHFTPLADALIVGSAPGTHNQAMMELGATVCLRQKPGCRVCPVAGFCRARSAGEPEKLPRIKPKVIEDVAITRAWCLHRGQLLLKREHAKARRLSGIHELPACADLGLQPTASSLLLTKRRAITRYRITESIYKVNGTAALRKSWSKSVALVWVNWNQLDQITLSGPHKRWIQELRSLGSP